MSRCAREGLLGKVQSQYKYAFTIQICIKSSNFKLSSRNLFTWTSWRRYCEISLSLQKQMQQRLRLITKINVPAGFHYGPGTRKIDRLWGGLCLPGLTLYRKACMHKKVQFKMFGSSVKPSCPPAGNVEETSECATKIWFWATAS